MLESTAGRLYFDSHKDSIGELAFRVTVAAWISPDFRFIQQKIQIWKLQNDEPVQSDSKIFDCYDKDDRQIVSQSFETFKSAYDETISLVTSLEEASFAQN